jgi:NAD(P)H dehydrogenase (quinone)
MRFQPKAPSLTARASAQEELSMSAPTTDRPIRHAVILTHPDRHSFNAAIASAYCDTVRESGQEVVLRDLYRMRFNPVLRKHERPGRPGFRVSPDVAQELEILDGCDVFVFVYPIWFGMPPAMTKGYIDRVIGSGVTAHQVRERQGKGPLNAAYLLCITTSGTEAAWLDEQGHLQAQRDLSSRYLFRAFAMKSAQMMHIGDIGEGLSQRVIDQHLDEVRQKARDMCAKLHAERHDIAPLATIGDGS